MNSDFGYIVHCFFIVFMMMGFVSSVESLPPATDIVETYTRLVNCDPDDENWVATQPIETIQTGGYVLSKDELSGHISCEPVSSPTIIPDQEIFEVYMRNLAGESSQIDATGNHPFFANGEWTRVDELGPGDVVQSRGEDLEVVEVLRTQRVETVYNFTVSNHLTYFVGENAAWVHNIQNCPDMWFPDRVLPTSGADGPIPDVLVPHTQLGRSKAKYDSTPQNREWDYGSNGKLQPKRDIDFTDHGYPAQHPNPHQHKFTPNNPILAPKGGVKRGPPEPL